MGWLLLIGNLNHLHRKPGKAANLMDQLVTPIPVEMGDFAEKEPTPLEI